MEAERGAAGQAAQWRADAGAAAAQLAEARRRLVDTDAALLQRDEEVCGGGGVRWGLAGRGGSGRCGGGSVSGQGLQLGGRALGAEQHILCVRRMGEAGTVVV